MTTIREFKSIRPSIEMAEKVAALPYDVYNRAEAREVVKDNPYSFLHIDRAEVDLSPDIDLYSKEVYLKAKENLDNFLSEKIFVQDVEVCLYIYRLTMNNRSQVGLVCCSSIDDYLNGKIKRHELTREDKEVDRINHVDYCDANTGPIFLTYRSQEKINNIMDKWITSVDSLYDFVSDDEIRHEVWVINNQDVLDELKTLFKKIDSTYIADGHHRTASAVKVGLKRREENQDFDGTEEFNFFLSVLFPDDQLYIMDYNRVVKDLNGLDKNDFISKLEDNFVIVNNGSTQYKPSEKGSIGMYLDGNWYKLQAKGHICSSDDPVKRLDVSILQEYVLTPILNITDIRTDKRIDFVGGIRGLDELEKRCNEDMKLAFAMYPTSIDELMTISDNNKLMPPKSTWFEPKLRSGLFIHKLSE